MKRFDIGTVYHKSIAGGQPKEALEASFDIVQDETNCRGHHLEAEALLVVCQVMSAVPRDAGKFTNNFHSTSRYGFIFSPSQLGS
jgi:hypothetical protein